MNGPNNPIGWCTHTWNPVKGICPVGCDYCYARRIYERFSYDSTIRLDERELYAPLKLKKPAKIFVCSTMELFGPWIPLDWLDKIFQVAAQCEQHTFLFLSKNPGHIPQGSWKRGNWSYNRNFWFGVSVTSIEDTWRIRVLTHIQQARNRFLSFEPLHGDIHFFDESDLNDIDWVIIGAEIGNRKGKITPEEEWIFDIVDQADGWNVPVFMKDNLQPYWSGKLRQEFPK